LYQTSLTTSTITMNDEYLVDHNKLSTHILAALALWLITGLVINFAFGDVAWVEKWVVDGLFEVVGEMFIRFLTMLIVPIVLVSLISGVASLADPRSLGRVSAKAVGLYLLTTGVAIILALIAGLLLQTGVGANPVSAS